MPNTENSCQIAALMAVTLLLATGVSTTYADTGMLVTPFISISTGATQELTKENSLDDWQPKEGLHKPPGHVLGVGLIA